MTITTEKLRTRRAAAARRFRKNHPTRISEENRRFREINPNYMKRYREKNKEKIRIKERAYKQEHKEKHRLLQREYERKNPDRVLRRQEREAGRPKPGKCEICSESDSPIVFDHCHQRNIFRAWICNGCNIVLGIVKEDTNRLRMLIAFLENTNKPL